MEPSFGWLAILPPVIAIGLAIWKREVVISLLLGTFVGVTIINGWNPVKGLLETFSTYIVGKSLADAWNVGVILFCLAIGGMIGIISKTGGTKAIADALTRKASSTRSTMLATFLMTLAIFFDDYANSLLVGNTMRPISDSQNISREKFSYIIDTGAASASSIAPVSTWIAMEIGLIATAFQALSIKANPMIIFFQTIPFRFYSLLALLFAFMIIFLRRDFGPMLEAELRARRTGKVNRDGAVPIVTEDKSLLPDEGIVGTIYDMLVPLVVFLLVVVVGLWYNGGGMEKSIKDAFGDADASVVLTWGAFISSIVIIVKGVINKKFTLKEAVDSWIAGVKTMLVACIVLCLAFALKAVIDEMGLSTWIIDSLRNILSGHLVPALTFVVAAFIATATGTSWGTCAILMPIAIPISVGFAEISGGSELGIIVIATIGSVLTGSVMGDHCSPISDTTILSSTGAGADHIDHVRTQMPYAIVVAVIAFILFIFAGYGLNPLWCLLLGAATVFAIIRFVGTKYNDKGEII